MRRILFVDDDPGILQGLRRMLHPLRHEWDMTFVTSGQEALAVMAQSSFDVVVSDMRMPGMDGAQLLTEVSKLSPRAVRIILSGYSEREMVLRSVKPAHQYLSKPCQPETLKSAVTRALALRELLDDSTLTGLISGMQSLPSLPSMYAEIMTELRSPEASVARVAEIVSRDIGMTARILQIINSAFFGLPCHVTSAAQAVGLLGLDTIKGLALTLQIFERFDEEEMRGFPVERLWEHSLAVAASARRISKRQSSDERISDDAFLAGLLHDVGILVLIKQLPTSYVRVLTLMEEKKISQWQAEREVLGITHAEVGAYLLALWGLPDSIIEAVAYHHCPEKCPNRAFGPLSAVYEANEKDSGRNMQPTIGG
jgi:HD-like signal output (HDOD) protein/CheY-like chemotaxis protein